MLRFLIIISAYIACQMLSDIASLKIVILFGMSMDAGTLIYPLTFTLRDLVHKSIGKRASQYLIVIAAFINLFMAILFWFVSWLPADLNIGPQSEFGLVLSPLWRLVVASILAEVIAELIDTEVYSKWVDKFGEKHQWGRVLSSNLISVPLDSFVFCLIAFYGTMPLIIVISIFVANVIIKGVTTLFSIPLIYTIPSKKLVINE